MDPGGRAQGGDVQGRDASTLGLIALLLLSCCPVHAAPAELPPDLVGSIAEFHRAWTLGGLAPNATVAGFAGEKGDELLVAGTRLGEDSPRLGDLALVAPEGFARRRISTDAPLLGLPAMVGRIALGCTADGQLTLWTLTAKGAESSPRQIALGPGVAVGPVALGRTALLTAGARVLAVSDLFETRWERDLGTAVTQPLATDRTHVFAATATALVALDLEDGSPRWQAVLPAAALTALRVTGGLVMAGLADGSVRSWDSESGAPVWTRNLAPAVFSREPALAGPWLLVTCADGRLVGLDTDSGEITWTATAPGPLSSPTVGYGHVFVTTGDGVLRAVPFNRDSPGLTLAGADPDGRPLRLLAAPCLADQRVYVVSESGLLLAVDLKGAVGPVEWPLPGGTAQRCGRTVPPEDLPEPPVIKDPDGPAAQPPDAKGKARPPS